MKDELYRPSAWQANYHSRTEHEVLGAGAAGPGKTECLLHDADSQIVTEHQRCADPNHPYPLKWGHSKGWALHLRRTFPMLTNTLVRAKRVFPQMDPGVHYDTQNHTFIFSSGFRFQFGHCQNADDWLQYQSAEFTHIAYDELSQFDKEQYEQINTRLRSSDPVLRNMLKIRAMSNPIMRREENFNSKLKDPFWVRKRFVEPCRDGNTVIKKKIVRANGEVAYRTRIYLPASLYDNPDKEFVRQYESQLLDKPPHIRSALLYGNWYQMPGSFYGDAWDDNEHVCKPFRIPDHWPRFRSMDWGYKAPGCVGWWAISDDETLYCEREYTFQGQEVPQVARRIAEIEKDLGLWHKGRSLITGPADTQLWEQRGDAVRTKAAEFAAHGVPWTQADKRSRSRAAQLFLGRLSDHQNHTRPAGVVFFETCRMSRNTIPGIMADPGDPETPQDGGEDHWHDMVLYACSFASHGRAGVPAVKRYVSDGSGDDDDDAPAPPKTVNLYKRAYGAN